MKHARIEEPALREQIADKSQPLFVAERPEGTIVGCVQSQATFDDLHGETAVHPSSDRPKRATLGLFAVDPAVQSGGIGRALVDVRS